MLPMNDNMEDTNELFMLIRIDKPRNIPDTNSENADDDLFKLRHLVQRQDIDDTTKSNINDIADVFELISKTVKKPEYKDGLSLRHVNTANHSSNVKKSKPLIKKGADEPIDNDKFELMTKDKLELMKEDIIIEEDSITEDSDIITVTEITRAEEEMKELTNIPGFTATELLTINKMLKEDIKPLIQEVIEKPFMIIDLVKHGLLPVYNEEFTFETRILINTSINALSEDDLQFLEMQYQKILTSPSRTLERKTSSKSGDKKKVSNKIAKLFAESDKQEHALREQTVLPNSLIQTRLKRFGPNQPINIIGFLVPINFFRRETINKLLNRILSTSGERKPIRQLSTCISNPSLYSYELARLALRPPIQLSSKYNITDIESLFHNIKWAARYYKQQFPAAEAHEIVDSIITRPVIELKKGKAADIRADKTTVKSLPATAIPMNIMSFMKEHGMVAFDTPFLDAIFCELYNVNLLELYIYKYVLGVKLDVERHPTYYHLASAMNKDLLLLRQYEYVYRILYGVQTYNRLIAANPNIQTSIQFLNLLSDIEREEVIAEYERQMAFWKSFLDNRCDHKSALYSFYRAVSIEDQSREYKALKEFIDYIPSAKEHSYAKCKVCKFDLICPHRLATAEYMTQGFSLNRRVNNLNMELNTFADNDINDPRFYFCIICGEKLFERDEWLGAKLDVAIPYEERHTMWFEAGMIINRFVTFTIAIDVQNTIDLMVKFCYPILLDYMQKLYIDSTNEAEFSLMIKIVFAAYFEKMMKSSNKMVTFDVQQFERTLSIKERDRFKKLFKDIGDRITNQKIADRELFVYTYSLEERIEDMVLKDPVFLMYFKTVHDDLAPSHLPEAFITKLLSLAHMYDIIELKRITTSLDYEKLISKFDTELILDSIYAQDINKLAHNLEILEYNKLLKYLKNITKWNKIYTIVPNTIDTRNPNDPTNTPKDVVETIMKIQEVLYRYEDSLNRRPRWSPKVLTDEKFKLQYIHLGELYDEYGTKHVWDSLVIGGSENNKLSKGKEVAEGKIISRKDYSISMGSYTDLYASNTKVYLSKARELDEKKIKDALRSANLIVNVFNFFTTRCPEDGMHERKSAADKCSKCGLQQGMSEIDRKKYVIKYMTVYNTELAKDLASDEYEGTTVKQPEVEVIKGMISDKYKYDENTIKLVAGKLGIEFNALRHLGAMQGHLYTDIIKGYITPALPKTVNDYRIALLHSYIMSYLSYKSTKRLLTGREFDEYAKNRKLAIASGDIKTVVYYHVMFLCHDLITFMSQHAAEAKEVIANILRSDMLLCKNLLSVFELREIQDDLIATNDEYAEKLDEENPASLSYDGFDFEGFDDADNVD